MESLKTCILKYITFSSALPTSAQNNDLVNRTVGQTEPPHYGNILLGDVLVMTKFRRGIFLFVKHNIFNKKNNSQYNS